MTTFLHRVATAQQGLDLEARLFADTQHGALVWTSHTHGIVCPAAFERKAGFARTAHYAGLSGWPVTFRPTGGGAVPQGPGIVNLAFAYDAPSGATVDAGYQLITDILRDAMGDVSAKLRTEYTPNSFCDGAWNLTLDGRKIAGTAQRWRPRRDGSFRVLAHALLLVSGALEAKAGAVASFHKELGLPPVYPDTHVTLSSVCRSDVNADLLAGNLLRCTQKRLPDRQAKAAA